MKNIKLIRFVEALILLPMTTMSGVPVGPIAQATANIVGNSISPQTVLSQKLNSIDEFLTQKDIKTNVSVEESNNKIKAEKADLIDTHFKERDMPLVGMGMKMVEEAEKNGLDWRLLPAIAVRESTGGKFACKKATYNSFGWGSCKISFKSNEQAIETVARNLGGNNPKTAHHYDEKTTKEILRAYNPPSIVLRYAEQVMAIMDAIGPSELGESENSKVI
jgi:hypothetical protein